MGLGSILIAVVKFLLKSVLFVLKTVLYGTKWFLLLFVLVARVFLIFAKAAMMQMQGMNVASIQLETHQEPTEPMKEMVAELP